SRANESTRAPAPRFGAGEPETYAAAHVKSNWISRAVISGFMASTIMALLFFVAFAAARLLTITLPITGPLGVMRLWFTALTSNRVLDLATEGIYIAGALHILVGIGWALVYAYFFEE